MPRLIAVDLDGTLFDTEAANAKAYRDAAAEYGITLTIPIYTEKCSGKNYKDFLPEIIGNDDPYLVEGIHNVKQMLYQTYIADVPVNEELVEDLRKRNERTRAALVTTAGNSAVRLLLETFGLTNLFDFLITKEAVGRCKPFGDCYKKAMKIAGANTFNTVVYEDSNIGIAAARNAGIKDIRIVKKFCPVG